MESIGQVRGEENLWDVMGKVLVRWERVRGERVREEV